MITESALSRDALLEELGALEGEREEILDRIDATPAPNAMLELIELILGRLPG